jgi:predicted naringenin-chalcone synthase
LKTIVRSLATAHPDLYVTQDQALGVFTSAFALGPEETSLYRKVLGGKYIRGRYIGMDSIEQAAELDPDELNQRFLKHGRRIATEAARRALDQAGLAPGAIGGLVVNTCTGYLCPGLSSYVAEALGLPSFLKLADLMGMGCGAAIPNLETAFNMLGGRNPGPVLSVAVEICSATLFLDPDPGQVVSNCIFGDGAAAAVLDRANGRGPAGLFSLLDFESALFPEHRDQLRYQTERHRLKNILTRSVPAIGARAIEQVVARLLARHGLQHRDIQWWAVHPGGRQVLEAVARRIPLTPHQLRFSYRILEEYGNMSSPSVLFVVRRIMDECRPPAGDKGLLLTFGAGFSAHALLVEF